jgi:hypothetical protein
MIAQIREKTCLIWLFHASFRYDFGTAKVES